LPRDLSPFLSVSDENWYWFKAIKGIGVYK
jgi:hypothetical protein